jgi:hypothetical protein
MFFFACTDVPIQIYKSHECQAVSKVYGHRQMTDIWFVAEEVIFILTTKSTLTLGPVSNRKGTKGLLSGIGKSGYASDYPTSITSKGLNMYQALPPCPLSFFMA